MTIVVITSFAKHQNRWRLSNWNLLILHLHYSRSYIIYNYIYSCFHHIRHFVTFGVPKSFVHEISCQLQLNFLPYITNRWYYCWCRLFKSEKWCHHRLQDDYLWQESNPHCPNFSLLTSWILSCVTTACYTFLHQATRDETMTTIIFIIIFWNSLMF